MRKNNKGNRGPQPQAGTQTVVSERPAHIDNGEDARGTVNARENQTRTQPEPSPGLTALSANADTSADVIALRVPKGQRANILDIRHHALTEQMKSKQQQMQEATQRLAEAADLSEEGIAKSKEARIAADRASVLLYQARVSGAVSADEITSLLGDKFGYRVKGGTDKFIAGASGGKEPSKTPYGDGEAIRKRIVRAVQAHEFVNNGDGGKFFNFEPDATDENGTTVADVLRNMENGELGFWAAYEALAKIKRDNAVKTSIAYDAKKIAALAESLNDEGFAKALASDTDLQDAYTALRDMINLTAEEAGRIAAKAA